MTRRRNLLTTEGAGAGPGFLRFFWEFGRENGLVLSFAGRLRFVK